MPRRVNKIAVVGGGQIGSEIAMALILSNYQVILKEVDDKLLQAAIGKVRGESKIPYLHYSFLIMLKENNVCFAV